MRRTASTAATATLDPRSYPAKTVPQRLMIISAGVIMNLIFAVIFGMVAYRMGVSYMPCLVGATSPGLSAWNVGLQSGDRIVQLGEDGTYSRHLRFDKDMSVTVMMTGPNRPLDLLVERYAAPGEPTAEPQWITVQLSSPQQELHGRPIIGISPSGSQQVVMSDALRDALGHLNAMRAQPALQDGDEIVAVDGEAVADYTQLSRQLARRVDQPVRLTVRRTAAAHSQAPSTQPASETLEVVIPPQPMRWLGLNMQIGPIVSVQQGSPAAQAGVLPGDRILRVDGQPVDNPLTLSHLLRRMAGRSVELTVVRDGAELTLPVTLRDVQMLHTEMSLRDAKAAEALGVAYTVENKVAAVESGSPAAAAGLQTGDLIEQVQFLAASTEDADREEQIFGREVLLAFGAPPRRSLGQWLTGRFSGPKPRYLSPDEWIQVEQRVQLSLPSTKVRLTYSRQGNRQEVELQPVELAGWFSSDRGLKLMTAEEVHKETSWLRPGSWDCAKRARRFGRCISFCFA